MALNICCFFFCDRVSDVCNLYYILQITRHVKIVGQTQKNSNNVQKQGFCTDYHMRYVPLIPQYIIMSTISEKYTKKAIGQYYVLCFIVQLLLDLKLVLQLNNCVLFLQRAKQVFDWYARKRSRGHVRRQKKPMCSICLRSGYKRPHRQKGQVHTGPIVKCTVVY